MSDVERTRRQAAARSKRYRDRQKARTEIAATTGHDLAAAYATPLLTGQLPEPEPEAPWLEGDVANAADPRAVPGQREYVPTPYGAEARIRAQRELDSREVVDYVNRQPEERQESVRERVLRSLPNWKRRDAAQREQAIRRAEAEAAGELTHATQPDWAWLTEVEGRTDRDWQRELARRTDQQDLASEGEPYRHTAHFTNDWDEAEPMMIDAPPGFR